MEQEKYQKELFELEKPKRSFPRLFGLFPKANLETNFAVTLSPERAIFLAIGIIMLMVVVYAVGVEVGKSRRPATKALAAPAEKQRAASAAPQKAPEPSPAKTAGAGRYMIIAGTFKNRDSAMKAAYKLKKAGMDVYIAESGAYFQVRCGPYANTTGGEALKDLKTVRGLQPDAYFKLK